MIKLGKYDNYFIIKKIHSLSFRCFSVRLFILTGNPYIFDRIIWNNCKDDRIFHLGGRTNLIDDNLFKFKNKFSDTLSKYCVGGIIHIKQNA